MSVWADAGLPAAPTRTLQQPRPLPPRAWPPR
jgi:hypothetical protein